MSSLPDPKRARWPGAFALCLALLVIVLCAAIGGIRLMRRHIENEIAQFHGRATEAKSLVVQIYGYYLDHGTWPGGLSEVTRSYREIEDRGWEYCWEGRDSRYGPVLRLHGPYHTFLTYRFPANREQRQEMGWRCSSEGSPVRMDTRQEIPAGFFRKAVRE
jgi:hypothetical protein